MKKQRLVTAALVIVGVVVVAVLGMRLYMGRDTEDRVEEGEVVDFDRMAPPSKPAIFMMCPVTLCDGHADAVSPVFDMDWERLRDYWSEMIARQPRVKLVAGDGDRQKLTYIQHSAVFRFPDIITIQFMPLEDGRSTFAIHSASRYGQGDFGVNRDRVLKWVHLLQTIAKE